MEPDGSGSQARMRTMWPINDNEEHWIFRGWFKQRTKQDQESKVSFSAHFCPMCEMEGPLLTCSLTFLLYLLANINESLLGPSKHHFMANRWGNSGWLYFSFPKSLQMVTAAMKLKDALLLGRKVMTNLDSILKSRDITLPTKVHLVKDMWLDIQWSCMDVRVGL